MVGICSFLPNDAVRHGWDCKRRAPLSLGAVFSGADTHDNEQATCRYGLRSWHRGGGAAVTFKGQLVNGRAFFFFFFFLPSPSPKWPPNKKKIQQEKKTPCRYPPRPPRPKPSQFHSMPNNIGLGCAWAGKVLGIVPGILLSRNTAGGVPEY